MKSLSLEQTIGGGNIEVKLYDHLCILSNVVINNYCNNIPIILCTLILNIYKVIFSFSVPKCLGY